MYEERRSLHAVANRTTVASALGGELSCIGHGDCSPVVRALQALPLLWLAADATPACLLQAMLDGGRQLRQLRGLGQEQIGACVCQFALRSVAPQNPDGR